MSSCYTTYHLGHLALRYCYSINRHDVASNGGASYTCTIYFGNEMSVKTNLGAKIPLPVGTSEQTSPQSWSKQATHAIVFVLTQEKGPKEQ